MERGWSSGGEKAMDKPRETFGKEVL